MHVLTIVAVEDFDLLAVGDERPRDGTGVHPAALQLGVETVGVELVDLVQIAEDSLRARPSVRQVGHGQLVPVVDEDLLEVGDILGLRREKLPEDVLSPDLQRLVWIVFGERKFAVSPGKEK